MSRIPLTKTTTVYSDEGMVGFSLIALNTVSNGDTLNLSTVYSAVDLAIGMGGGSVLAPRVFIPSTSRYPTMVFDGSTAPGPETFFLMVIGQKAVV